MLVAQGCCVALGLHLHNLYLRASVEQAVEQVVLNAAGEESALTEGAEQTTPSVEGSGVTESMAAVVSPTIWLLSLFWIVAMQALIAFLTLARIYRESSEEMDELRMKTLTRERQVRKTRDALIFGLAALAESRDPETGQHLERISLYSSRLATEIYRRGIYPEVVTREFLRMIGASSTLHDIGKVSVRDDVLLKPGPLTNEERAHIQTHTIVGGECIRSVQAQSGDSKFLRMAREIAMSHHERWDGTGYPMKLKGEEIPVAARIVSIVDVYDALSVRRPYKEALTHEQCIELITEGEGTQFDPVIVETLLCIEEEFAEIARQHQPGDAVGYDSHALPFAVDEELPETEVSDAELGSEVVPLSLLLGSIQTRSVERESEMVATES